MTGLSRPETATQMRTSHQPHRPKKRRYRPLPTKPDLRRAQPPMKAFFLDEEEIFPRPGRSSVRRSSSDRKSTRLNSSHSQISYAVFCLNIKIFVCLSMVQLMAVFISMRCTLCGHFLQVALTLILVVGYAIAAS